MEASYLPTPSATRTPRRRRGALGAVAAALTAIAQLGAKLKTLLLLLPKAKLFATSASMLVSIAAYATLWGWRFAVGLVLLLLVHEVGHVIQLRREGIPASAPMFIPFLGALIMQRRAAGDAAAEARVGLAGPVLGSLGALVPLALYFATGAELWRALAMLGFFLNLFNLLPVLPLDGGRAMAALMPWMWVVGYGLLVVGAIAFPSPLMLLVLVLGGLETYRRWRARRDPRQRAYYRVAPRTRALVAAVYLGLALALAFGVHATYVSHPL